MATPVKGRRLSDEEGRQLQRIVRRGGGKSDSSIVKWRRALVVLASAGGNDVAAIARLVQTSPDRVREMIHSFNDKGMRALDPQWAGGRPRRITTEERQLIIKTATKRPRSLGQPFTRWSVRKLAQYLGTKKGREGHRSRASVCAKSWPRRRSPSSAPRPGRSHLTRCARRSWPASSTCSSTNAGAPLPSTSSDRWPSSPRMGRAGHRSPGHSGCGPTTTSRTARGSSSPGTRWEPTDSMAASSRRKVRARRLRALKAIRASVPDGEMIYVILDNLNHHKGPMIRAWCADNAVELAFTPTYGSWANPIEAHFGPLARVLHRQLGPPEPCRTRQGHP